MPAFAEPAPWYKWQSITGQTVCAGNRVLPGPITRATEAQEWRRWQDKLLAAKLAVGPSPAQRTAR